VVIYILSSTGLMHMNVHTTFSLTGLIM